MPEQSGREQLEKRLRDTCFKKSISIDHLSWQDVPDKDASELIIASGDKEKKYIVDDFALINDPDAKVEQIVMDLIDKA